MVCPYRNKTWSDEYYIYQCGIYEAKHQCMIANDVIILRYKQINNLTIDMFKLSGEIQNTASKPEKPEVDAKPAFVPPTEK